MSSNYWAPLHQLDKPQQPNGATAVLAAPQADGNLAANSKHMKLNEQWLVVGTLNVHSRTAAKEKALHQLLNQALPCRTEVLALQET